MPQKLEDLTKEQLLDIIIKQKEKLKNKKYGLVWDAEKEPEKIVVDCQNNVPILKDIKSKEISSDNGNDNILIEGDNYHALTCLNYTHKGKIDVIYIDPPYNTGKANEWKYNDKYVDAEDGYKHSKWLNMMGKRLDLAKNLLKDTGIIFISIDDNEQANLKLLCDEIFAEENFINQFIWKKNSSGKTEKSKFTVNTEYVLLYAKSNSYQLNPVYKSLAETTKSLYKLDDNDGRGRYRLYPLQKPASPGPETTYDYTDNTGKIWKCPKKGWRIKYSKLKDLENDGRLCLNNKTLSEKAYWNERENEGKRMDTLWDDLSENSKATRDLSELFEGVSVFNNPKPVDLIKRCLSVGKENSAILDFFAGSGTTGHAVLDLNKEDGGNRKFILCTNNEGNICTEVCYPRVSKVIKGYKKNGNGENVEGLGGNLKYLKTDLIPVDRLDNVSDKKRVEITKNAGEMIGLKEDTLEQVELNNFYQILSNKKADKFTAIYFRENEEKLEELIKKIGNKKTVLYVFSYGKVDRKMYKGLAKNITIEDIPEPIIEIYREINLKIEDK